MAEKALRLAMLGMVEGNGHPYSWSAIINGHYDRDVMAQCGYPVIPEYLAANEDKLGIPAARVTHVWADDPKDAENISKASMIEHVVAKPTDVLDQVDAVVLATDIGHEHVQRAKPFIEAGVPTFIDKPLTDNREDLLRFIEYYKQGKPILSTSCMRYASEIETLRQSQVGERKLVTGFTCKSWARYGIHALEGLYQITGPGYVSVRDVGHPDRHTIMLKHRSGVDGVLWAYYDAFGGFGAYQLIGSEGYASTKFADTFYAFKRQLEVFVEFVRGGGKPPFPPEETFELMAIIAGAIESQKQGGQEIELTEIIPKRCLPA